MSFLVHWIPALAGGFVLLIAGLVLEALIRAERRRHGRRIPRLRALPRHPPERAGVYLMSDGVLQMLLFDE